MILHAEVAAFVAGQFADRVVFGETQRLRMLADAIAKLDELLELLRDTKRDLSPIESKQVQQELEEIRARLLQDTSPKRSTA